ncbi:MAG: hypothetical protein DSY42_03360 [Aquifex sp.]|nr:MAG: hypothetical protein DSY42_03360 [Aquifex sp.]
MCGGENITFPCVEEKEDKIIIIYSDKEIVDYENDDGILIFFARDYDIVKIIIPKDNEHHIIYLQ